MIGGSTTVSRSPLRLTAMLSAPFLVSAVEESDAVDTDVRRAGEARLRALVVEHHGLVWRTARRAGVVEARVDDVVSRVFDVVARRLGEIEAGREVTFLLQTCFRVSSDFRRAAARRARFERQLESDEDAPCPLPSPEEVLESRRARALLDEALDALDADVRPVFVLHELEGWTSAAIAESLGIPAGTAGSRLRRAREQFQQAALRIRRRLERAEHMAMSGASADEGGTR